MPLNELFRESRDYFISYRGSYIEMIPAYYQGNDLLLRKMNSEVQK